MADGRRRWWWQRHGCVGSVSARGKTVAVLVVRCKGGSREQGVGGWGAEGCERGLSSYSCGESELSQAGSVCWRPAWWAVLLLGYHQVPCTGAYLCTATTGHYQPLRTHGLPLASLPSQSSPAGRG
jgi:hypothetical protein